MEKREQDPLKVVTAKIAKWARQCRNGKIDKTMETFLGDTPENPADWIKKLLGDDSLKDKLGKDDFENMQILKDLTPGTAGLPVTFKHITGPFENVIKIVNLMLTYSVDFMF